VPAPAPRELFAVVSDQLSALREANFAIAYQQATSDVQQKFTLPQFERMVRRQYSKLGKSGRVEFENANVDGATASVDVLLIEENGFSDGYEFTLLAESAGWKIGGVKALPGSVRRQGLVGLRL